MTEATPGVLDNYLSADEEAYFKSNGSDDSEAAVTQANEDSSSDNDNDADTDGDASADERTTKENAPDSGSVPEDEDLEEGADSDEEAVESKRDYEKAFKTERHKRKELKEALEAQARKSAEMEATLSELKKSMSEQSSRSQPVPPSAPVENIPDPEDDPLGYQQYKIHKLEKAIDAHNNYLQQQHQSQQRQSQEQAFLNNYRQSADTFKAQNPDFGDAYNYLTAARKLEHVAAGFSEAEAHSVMVEEEMSVVAKAYKDGVNPAERIYKLAKARGYTASTDKKTAPKNLESIKKGVANSKSLTGGGERDSKTMGETDIDSMNFNEFDKFFDSLKKKQRGR